MATKDQEVARNLLTYRYNQSAIENAEKLGFTNGAALYPMVTMNGEECHNEWEITLKKFIEMEPLLLPYTITIDTRVTIAISLKRFEVLIAIARFWHQRATFSNSQNQYVI
jgi:maltose phosphorylase